MQLFSNLMIVDRTTTIQANFKLMIVAIAPQPFEQTSSHIVGWALPQSFDVRVLQNGGHRPPY